MAETDDRGKLLGEIDALEALVGRMGALTTAPDVERKRELVGLRRELANQIQKIRILGEAVYTGRADAVDFDRAFARMRAQMARHQADWPVVTLGERPVEFERSAASLREANRQFIRWVRQSLGRG